MSHQRNLSLRKNPCGCGGFFRGKHRSGTLGKLCAWQDSGIQSSYILNLSCPATFCSSDKSGLETQGPERMALL